MCRAITALLPFFRIAVSSCQVREPEAWRDFMENKNMFSQPDIQTYDCQELVTETVYTAEVSGT